jgi:hypothetical protein
MPSFLRLRTCREIAKGFARIGKKQALQRLSACHPIQGFGRGYRTSPGLKPDPWGAKFRGLKATAFSGLPPFVRMS